MAEEKSAVSVKALVAVVALLAVAVAGYFGLRQLWKPPTQPDVDIGRAVAEAFLASVRSGKAGEAWNAATAEFKSIEGRESFIRKAKSTPILKDKLELASSQQVFVQDEPRTEYVFQSPNAKMVRILIGYERGDWKVDRLAL